MFRISFDQTLLTREQHDELNAMWLRCMRRVLVSTTLAGSGHPGGSMSSLHLLLMLYSTMRHDPLDPCWADRDRLLVSMGHISPGLYGVLCEFGYIQEEAMCLEFRLGGSPFAGHVEDCVPGVEWNTGNLGQGLSAGTGVALALKLKGKDARTTVLMGDGEQQKGQIAEARRFAVKYGLNNILCLVDRNGLQIGGSTSNVMPQAIRAEYLSSRWNVISVQDGHDFDEIFASLKRAYTRDVDDPACPTVIVARTVMGKGISFMENKAKYHGSTLKDEEAALALAELGLENPIPQMREKRKTISTFQKRFCPTRTYPEIQSGDPKTYAADMRTDNRSAYGAALEDLARLNNGDNTPKVLAFSCDLEGSVKMDGLHGVSPAAFFECGIQEHHAATIAGASSREGFASFFSTFGVFAVCETYNQHRLSDINDTNLKLVSTHLGLDVGEDGQTHQCVDYLGLMQNLFGFSIFMPADPNQTDRVIRYIAANKGNYFVGMGRSKVSVICNADGMPAFAGEYRFCPGKADWLRRGSDGAILSFGALLPEAIRASDALAEKHGLSFSVLNFASIKPIDRESILEAAQTGLLVSVEDHNAETGLGARVATVLADSGGSCRLIRLGVNSYGLSGSPAELYRMQGLDSSGIIARVLQSRSSALKA